MDLNCINDISEQDLSEKLTRCCGSSYWVKQMIKLRPFRNMDELFSATDKIWWSAVRADWLEAFSHHPRIGDLESLKTKFITTKDWSAGEQKSVNEADESILKRLHEGNKVYENKFGYIFIVCATGKSASEMLSLLEERLKNDPEAEIEIAAGENLKITKLRLEKLCKEAQLPHMS